MGHTYERSEIERWLTGTPGLVDPNNKSPKTGAQLRNQKLVPNSNVKQAIHHCLKLWPSEEVYVPAVRVESNADDVAGGPPPAPGTSENRDASRKKNVSAQSGLLPAASTTAKVHNSKWGKKAAGIIPTAPGSQGQSKDNPPPDEIEELKKLIRQAARESPELSRVN